MKAAKNSTSLRNYIVDEEVVELERKISIEGKYDVIVAGGGAAGIMAAIASARNGAKTLLIEQGGFLGGTLTAAFVLAFGQPSFASKDKQLIRGIPGEMVERLVNLGGFLRSNGHSPFDPELFKYVALKMVLEAGVKCRFYTAIVDSIVENNTIKGIITESKAGRRAFLAERVIDCTGDGDVAAKAGAPYTIGRETDHKVMPFTMGFIVGGVDLDTTIKYMKDNPDQFSKGLNRTILETESKPIVQVMGFFDITRKYGKDYGMRVLYTRFGNLPIGSGKEICWVNMTRAVGLNPLKPDDLTKAEIILREQVFSTLKFLKNHIPGFKNAYLLGTSPCLGIRQSRQIIGEYILRAEDVLQGRMFQDAILHSASSFTEGGLNRLEWEAVEGADGHPVDGYEGGPGSFYEFPPQKEWLEFEIPYGVSIPQIIENLLVAGKCKSATHKGMGKAKSAPVCMAEGQAAGTAAALSLKEGVMPRKLDIKKLQQQLRKDGVYLPE